MEPKPVYVKYCSLKGCNNNTNKGISIFQWPQNEDLKNKWKFFFARHGNTNVNKCFALKLCESHFDAEDINANGKWKRLKPGSVPKYENREVSSLKDPEKVEN